MLSCRSGRGLQWQPVKLWWIPCLRGLRQCWEIMVTRQNIDTLGPIWTFTFVASRLDINGCVLSYFEEIANLHLYKLTTTLHCSKVSFLQCCHMKIYNKIFTKTWGLYSLLWDTVCSEEEINSSTSWMTWGWVNVQWISFIFLHLKITFHLLSWNIVTVMISFSCYMFYLSVTLTLLAIHSILFLVQPVLLNFNLLALFMSIFVICQIDCFLCVWFL